MNNRLLLSCDDYIFEYNNQYYGHLSFYERYLRIFDTIRIAVRTKKIDIIPSNDYVKLDNEKIEVWPLPFFQGPKQYAKSYFKFIKSLNGVTQNCNAAILRLPSTTAYNLVPLLRKNKIPYCIEVVSDPYDVISLTKKNIYKFFYWSWYKQLIKACNNADGVACVTKDYLQKRYYSIKENHFSSSYSSISLSENHFISPKVFKQKDEYNIIHVSNKVTYNGTKGHKELIQAVLIVNKKGYNVNVHFVGSDYNDGIEKLKKYASSINASEKVFFEGFISSKDELFNKLKEADLFVLPTKVEGLPRVIIEAMAVGLPCITTNVSGNPELVQKELLIDDFYDTESLAEAIIKLVSNPELYEAVSKYNFENSLNYEASILQQRRDEFYTKLKNVCYN